MKTALIVLAVVYSSGVVVVHYKLGSLDSDFSLSLRWPVMLIHDPKPFLSAVLS